MRRTPPPPTPLRAASASRREQALQAQASLPLLLREEEGLPPPPCGEGGGGGGRPTRDTVPDVPRTLRPPTPLPPPRKGEGDLAALSPPPEGEGERAALRAKIAAIERSHPKADWGVIPFGDARVDSRLPGGGLPRGRWHEIAGAGLERELPAAAAGFAAILAGKAARGAVGETIVWALVRDDLHPPGLLAYGLAPERVIFVRADRDADVLAVMEDALRTRGVGAVVGELGTLDLVAGKRLALACERGGATAFVLRRRLHGARRGEAEDGSAATTRWRIAPASGGVESRQEGRFPLPSRGRGSGGGVEAKAFAGSRWRRDAPPPVTILEPHREHPTPQPPPPRGEGEARALHPLGLRTVPETLVPTPEPGLSAPRWTARLARCRGGRTGAWIMEACDDTSPWGAPGDVRVLAELADHETEAPDGGGLSGGPPRPRHHGDGEERAASAGGG